MGIHGLCKGQRSQPTVFANLSHDTRDAGPGGDGCDPAKLTAYARARSVYRGRVVVSRWCQAGSTPGRHDPRSGHGSHAGSATSRAPIDRSIDGVEAPLSLCAPIWSVKQRLRAAGPKTVAHAGSFRRLLRLWVRVLPHLQLYCAPATPINTAPSARNLGSPETIPRAKRRCGLVALLCSLRLLGHLYALLLRVC
jgi:hypothetical protein